MAPTPSDHHHHHHLLRLSLTRVRACRASTSAPAAGLPAQETCLHILEVIDELVDEKLLIIISSHMNLLGTPCCGSTGDIWSTRSCRDSFACLRGSFTLDGDLLATILKDDQHKHTVAFHLRESPLALMVLTPATSGPVVVDGESFLDALFASAGQG